MADNSKSPDLNNLMQGFMTNFMDLVKKQMVVPAAPDVDEDFEDDEPSASSVVEIHRLGQTSATVRVNTPASLQVALNQANMDLAGHSVSIEVGGQGSAVATPGSYMLAADTTYKVFLTPNIKGAHF